MPLVTYVLTDGSRRSLDLPVGSSLMEGAVGNGVPGVIGDCGGSCVCATCHLYVEDSRLDALPPLSEMEADTLDGVAAERRANSRLGCQIRVTPDLGGLVVFVPERQV